MARSADTPLVTPIATPAAGDAEHRKPRADRVDAAAWLLLGAVVLAGSWGMDRLENQDVPAYTAPGLLPGLLGVLLLMLGLVLLLRSLDAGVDGGGGGALREALGPAPGRALLTIGLCVLFGGVLVGHGLPFWTAAALFVAVSIMLLRLGPDGRRRRIDARGVITAAVIGLAAGFAITLVFQVIFLVRLP